jgi:simple sugar transport system permease protein
MALATDMTPTKVTRRLGIAGSPEIASLIILVVVLAAFAIVNDTFLSPLNVSNMLAFLPELGIIALGMTLLMTAGEFDLSVGAVFALGPVVVMLLVQNAGWDLGLALLLGLLICIVIGWINGILVTKVGISSFLVTLSMLLIVRGAALYITQGFPLKAWNQPGPLVTLLAGSFDLGPFRLYTSLWWFIGLIALSAYILRYAKVGNWISAIGSNRSAAVARGVPADKVKIWLFILTSVLAGLAGLRLPVQSHPLQALVSELLEQVLPCVVMSNAVHVYVSQAHKGELVMGAGIDSYNGYGQRGAVHVIEAQMAAALELFPLFAQAHVLRTWGGIVDTTPDASPIVGHTPVDGLFVNCGWGTGGFKGTPGSGWTYAHTIAHDEPHELNAPFALERFESGALIDEHGAAAVAH